MNSIENGMNETKPASMFDCNSALIINTLAKEFPVFDSGFASVPTGTDPKRAFAKSGTSQGMF